MPNVGGFKLIQGKDIFRSPRKKDLLSIHPLQQLRHLAAQDLSAQGFVKECIHVVEHSVRPDFVGQATYRDHWHAWAGFPSDAEHLNPALVQAPVEN